MDIDNKKITQIKNETPKIIEKEFNNYEKITNTKRKNIDFDYDNQPLRKKMKLN